MNDFTFIIILELGDTSEVVLPAVEDGHADVGAVAVARHHHLIAAVADPFVIAAIGAEVVLVARALLAAVDEKRIKRKTEHN